MLAARGASQEKKMSNNQGDVSTSTRRVSFGSVSITEVPKARFSVPLTLRDLVKVPLPPMDLWNHLVYPSTAITGTLDVSLSRASFPGRLVSTVSGPNFCVLSGKGYMMIYTGVKQVGDTGYYMGYTLDIRGAKKLSIVRETGLVKITLKWKHAILKLDVPSESDDNSIHEQGDWVESISEHFHTPRYSAPPSPTTESTESREEVDPDVVDTEEEHPEA